MSHSDVPVYTDFFFFHIRLTNDPGYVEHLLIPGLLVLMQYPIGNASCSSVSRSPVIEYSSFQCLTSINNAFINILELKNLRVYLVIPQIKILQWELFSQRVDTFFFFVLVSFIICILEMVCGIVFKVPF